MIAVVDPAARADWDENILSLPGSSFFHTSMWSDVLKESYRYRPVYFTEIENGEIKSVLPVMGVESFITGKRGVSLPFSDYCEPLAGDRVSFNALLENALEFGRREGWKYLEIRGGSRFLNGEEHSGSFLGHQLDLSSGAGDIMAAMRDSNRRNIKKAEKEGVQVEITAVPEALSDFYRLNCMTRKEHGLPPQPFSFFQAFSENVVSRGGAFITQAIYENKVIASNVYILFGKQAIYKYGASNKNYNHLRANNLVMWKAIECCCEIGIENLCLGRTELDHEGLRQFKSGWNAREYAIDYYRYSFAEGKFIKGSFGVPGITQKFFRKLPAPILNAAGSILYRHIG
jgi:hypothetical protein